MSPRPGQEEVKLTPENSGPGRPGMSQEDTPRSWPDSFDGSHCGRGFEGRLGAADPASRLLDVLTVQILSPQRGGVRG